MIDMENAEEILHFLEDFSKRKPKVIPQELNDYLAYVARTGDPVYQWALVKTLFKEKLMNVITDFYETAPGIEIPSYPNVDPFNYDVMKNSLLERLDSFTAAPFTVQRICELLTFPRKQYNRVDKFMRAVEKNILVVSTREPGLQRHAEPENVEPVEPIVNGSDNSDYNVDVEMEDMSWKVNAEPQTSDAQASSSEIHITVDDIETRLQSKQDVVMDTQEKLSAEYESVTPPEPAPSEEIKVKTIETTHEDVIPAEKEPEKIEIAHEVTPKDDTELKPDEPVRDPLIIPEIKVEDADMTEQRLSEESSVTEKEETDTKELDVVTKAEETVVIVESSSDSITAKDESSKVISEPCTSSEESSSSSDNTDGNSNSPKADLELPIESLDSTSSQLDNVEIEKMKPAAKIEQPAEIEQVTVEINSEGYSISDVKSDFLHHVAPSDDGDLKAEEPVKVEETADADKLENQAENSEILAETNNV